MTQQPADRTSAGYPTGWRLAAIVLLLLAWFPAALLGLLLPVWGGVVVGLPSAVCFVLAYRRNRAVGNLVGAAGALATPLVWLGMFLALLGGASLD